MKHLISFEHLPDYVYIQTEGEASFRGFESLLNELIASPQWKPGTKQLVDHTNLEKDHLTSDEIDAIAAFFNDNRKMIGNGKCAFVVSDSAGFGMIRMYALFGGELVHPQSRVFYSVEKAAEWLKS